MLPDVLLNSGKKWYNKSIRKGEENACMVNNNISDPGDCPSDRWDDCWNI